MEGLFDFIGDMADSVIWQSLYRHMSARGGKEVWMDVDMSEWYRREAESSTFLSFCSKFCLVMGCGSDSANDKAGNK